MTTDTKPWLCRAKITMVSLAVTSSTLQTTAAKSISFPHLNREVFSTPASSADSVWGNIFSPPLGKHPHILLSHPPVSFSAPFFLGTPDKHPRKVKLHPLFFFMSKKEGRQKACVHLPYLFPQCWKIKDSDRSNLWDQGFMSAHSPRTVLCDPKVKAAKAWRCPSHPTTVQNQRLVLMAFSFKSPGSLPLGMWLPTDYHRSSTVMVIKMIPTVMPSNPN